MTTRLLVPVLLLAGAVALVATAEDASASPLTAGHTDLVFGPRVHVGVGVTVPVGHGRVYGHGHGHRHVHVHRRGYRRVAYREVVEIIPGYYETRTKKVRVHGEQIGWDLRGDPLYGPERIEIREYQVWVPAQRVVRRVPVRRYSRVVHARPRGFVTVGGSVRVR